MLGVSTRLKCYHFIDFLEFRCYTQYGGFSRVVVMTTQWGSSWWQSSPWAGDRCWFCGLTLNTLIIFLPLLLEFIPNLKHSRSALVHSYLFIRLLYLIIKWGPIYRWNFVDNFLDDVLNLSKVWLETSKLLPWSTKIIETKCLSLQSKAHWELSHGICFWELSAVWSSSPNWSF